MGWRLNCMGLRNPRFTCNPTKIKDTRHAFFEDYRIFWFLLKMLGLFPYRINKYGDLKFKLLSKEVIYSALIWLLITAPVSLVLKLRYFQHNQVNNYEQKVYLYVLAILMLPHLCVPLTHWYELPLFEMIFKRWRQFQNAYEETFNEKLSLKPHWTTKLLLCGLFTITLAAMSMEFVIVGYQFCWEIFAHLHVLHIFFLHNLLLIGLCCRLRVIARDVRSRLVQAVKMGDVLAVERISSFWVTFSQVIRLVGTLFYRMYGYLFLTIFAVSTVVLFSLLRAIACNQLRLSMIHDYSLLLSNGAWIYLACEFGERVAHDAGNKLIMAMAKLRGSVKTTEMKTEIDSFISLISSFPPYVSLNEYVVINRKLFVSVNMTMVTYLIVVLQFSQDYSDPQLKELILPSNLTGFE